MKRIRDMEVVTCCICGEEFDKIKTRPLFTGRVKYMCPKCEAMANKEIASSKSAWRNTDAGKKAIEINELKKRRRSR